MTEKNMYLLELINQNLSNDEICFRLNISKKQLKRRVESIKYYGYNVDKCFSYDGTYRYFINYDVIDNMEKNKVFIHDVSDEFRFVAISDTHFGHSRSNIDYVNKLYEYCNDNNINIVFHIGDVLEGVFQSEMNHLEQIKYLLEEYPMSDDILTFMAFGNHEYEFATDCGFDLNRMIERNRDDIIPLGYGLSKIDINNNTFFVSHKKNFPLEYGLKLAGHSHRYKLILDRQGPIVVVPTLSNYLHTTDYPGALDIDIKLDSKENFDKMVLKHLTINRNNIRQTSYIEVPFKRDQGIKRIR